VAGANVAANDLALMTPVCATGMDIAQAVRSNRADCGIATRSVALAAGLNFLPITWEHFDLVLRQRDYFLPGPQALFEFMRTAALRERAMELGGYDVDAIGAVRLVNGRKDSGGGRRRSGAPYRVTRGRIAKGPFQRAIKQAVRGAYRCEAADGEQSLTATAAAVASCHRDEFPEGVHHEEAERAQSTQG